MIAEVTESVLTSTHKQNAWIYEVQLPRRYVTEELTNHQTIKRACQSQTISTRTR
uniref:Uncharacterized protein n=1 Tax=Arundo donax TaxID=35708 RepID=A0A0A9A0R5_ARUDO